MTALEPTNVASSSRRWSIFLGCAIIVLAALSAYYNSFAVPFVLDDDLSISQNPTIRHLWPVWQALSPPARSTVGGRPVVNLSYAINYAAGGTRVQGYHVLNLAIHILAALTLFGVIRRTLLGPMLRERFGMSATPLALTVAVLWTVHPLQTEAVTYISERCESLMGLFYLLTLYGFIRGTENRQSRGWFAIAVMACVVGMASKEVMATAPVIVLLYDRTFISGSFREAWTRHKPLYFGLAGSWLLLAYLMAGLHQRNIGYGLGISWWPYAMVECRTVIHYLRLAIWPHPLVFDYGKFVPVQHVAEIAPYAAALTLLVAGVLLELTRPPTPLKTESAVGFAGAWFLLILSPTSSVVPIEGQAIAEHRMYLPLAGVIAVIVLVTFEIGKRLFHKSYRVPLGCAASAAMAVLLIGLTVQRNQLYASALLIWQDTVEKRPSNPRAHHELGNALLQNGQVERAIDQYERALQIQPDFTEAHNNLAVALQQKGSTEEAIGHYQQAIRIDPRYAEPHNNLGAIYQRMGKLPEAIDQYQQALHAKPDYVEAHFNLGLALESAGHMSEAMEQYKQALKLRPDFTPAKSALARLGASQ